MNWKLLFLLAPVTLAGCCCNPYDSNRCKYAEFGFAYDVPVQTVPGLNIPAARDAFFAAVAPIPPGIMVVPAWMPMSYGTNDNYVPEILPVPPGPTQPVVRPDSSFSTPPPPDVPPPAQIAPPPTSAPPLPNNQVQPVLPDGIRLPPATPPKNP